MNNLTTILKGKTPVLIDFYADWCQPCKMMTPILKELKDDLGENIIILKINVDKNTSIAEKYQIKGVPTFMLFKNNKMLWRQSGLLYKNDLINIIKEYQNN
ncbi:thioredoxin [Tenacibaculum piscium]|uniref:Thioredoxin n=1 Tax=Tenacibaculum piscium TaxID=1458515 RepID=A0A2H1YJD6_9FLAO|nr:thioredoxin [Tenacibaculum piscium]MBE7630060.1 thioredoxin [Tenacibaculum piscium]MBE7671035.1 thioredoxin [Tenacibaculum piscium]MBE7690860.1 thioredoxin [Tenacibaculum piscium]MCG8184216.1 thioredoxin [Tenacibaculum piscium]MCG8205616.1 thioredoxin [Tenacibaculum piscium]